MEISEKNVWIWVLGLAVLTAPLVSCLGIVAVTILGYASLSYVFNHLGWPGVLTIGLVLISLHTGIQTTFAVLRSISLMDILSDQRAGSPMVKSWQAAARRYVETGSFIRR